MARLKLSEIARITGGELIGEDRECVGLATDSRKVKVGQLFAALKGERDDGHRYVIDAVQRGASGVLVERVVPGTESAVVVESVPNALRELVKHVRRNFRGQVVAVLGATGKTTTKEMLLHVLRNFYNVTGPLKSFNNLIGIALTVLNASGEEDVWVLEIGANRPGEIRELSSITSPDHVVYTKLGPEHLEGFGNTYNAVMEEYSALNYVSGYVFVPDDAPHFPEKPHYRYGFSEGADYRGENLKISEEGVEFLFKNHAFFVPYPHFGFAENALAVVAFCDVFGIPLENVSEILRYFKGQPMRMEIIRLGNKTVINDAYNSNPISVLGILKSVNSIYPNTPVLFVFGDMLELGEESEYWHRWAGGKMCRYGVGEVVGYGKYSRFTVEEAQRCGVKGKVMESHGEIARYVRESAYEIVVVKGSRGMEMERVVEALKGK